MSRGVLAEIRASTPSVTPLALGHDGLWIFADRSLTDRILANRSLANRRRRRRRLLARQIGGVFGGGVGDRVTQPPFVGVQPAVGFQAGALPAQPGGGGGGRDGFDVLDHVEAAGPG